MQKPQNFAPQKYICEKLEGGIFGNQSDYSPQCSYRSTKGLSAGPTKILMILADFFGLPPNFPMYGIRYTHTYRWRSWTALWQQLVVEE